MESGDYQLRPFISPLHSQYLHDLQSIIKAKRGERLVYISVLNFRPRSRPTRPDRDVASIPVDRVRGRYWSGRFDQKSPTSQVDRPSIRKSHALIGNLPYFLKCSTDCYIKDVLIIPFCQLWGMNLPMENRGCSKISSRNYNLDW